MWLWFNTKYDIKWRPVCLRRQRRFQNEACANRASPSSSSQMKMKGNKQEHEDRGL